MISTTIRKVVEQNVIPRELHRHENQIVMGCSHLPAIRYSHTHIDHVLVGVLYTVQCTTCTHRGQLEAKLVGLQQEPQHKMQRHSCFRSTCGPGCGVPAAERLRHLRRQIQEKPRAANICSAGPEASGLGPQAGCHGCRRRTSVAGRTSNSTGSTRARTSSRV